MTKGRVSRRTSYYLTLASGDEVELKFEPIEWSDVLVEEVGDKLIVGYLSLDSDYPNPMKERDCQGNLYLRRERNNIFTDRGEMVRALHLDSDGTPNTDRRFQLDGRSVTLRELAEKELATLPDSDSDEDRSSYDADTEERAIALYRQHWRAIVGPYVVPVSYHSERGSTSIGPTGWDGDTDDLPDGVWVADAGAGENIALNAAAEPGFTQASDEVLRAVAVEYAKAVLDELADWCDGNIFGACVETFVKEDDSPGWKWERTSDDACWGYIGLEYAEAALKEEFEAAVKEVQA